MPLSISRLRRWFAVGAIAIAMVVAGAYLYARWKLARVASQTPRKMNLEFQQTAQGFTVSKSEEGRTIFTIRASNAVQFKQGGHAELRDVSITVYGKDSRRFDQIYGSHFDYDPQSGTVVARGEVQIDLEANPAGLTQPDQAPPKELKNPVHLKTSGLVFNQKTGDAHTPEKVEFRVPQASGSAVGAAYRAKDGVLDLQAQVNITFSGDTPATVTAVHGVIRKDPRQIVLDHPQMVQGAKQFESDRAIILLRDDSTVDRVLATSNVRVHAEGESAVDIRSDRAELLACDLGHQRSTLRTAVLSGNVQMESSGPQKIDGNAGRLILNFAGKNILTTARAEENVELVQHNAATPISNRSAAGQPATAQDVEVTAPIVDFVMQKGRRLQSAVTSGAAQITILPAASTAAGQRTVVTAGRFEAKFDERSRLSSIVGTPDARIVNSAPGQPERVSTSRELDVSFRSAGGIDSVVQRGSVAYVDGSLKAWGDRARYTPVDQMLYLSGSPRVIEGGMTTTAHAMRMNRATGEAFADGDVKSTYSELRPQFDGALLASSAPIHVTARNMVTHRNPRVATYTGNARLWQDANIVEALSIDFDRERRSVLARGAAAQPVSTALVQVGKDGKQTPVGITSERLTYTDSERRAHFEGGVVVKSEDATMTADSVDAYLQPRKAAAGSAGQQTATRVLEGGNQLDRIVADGHIVIVQPKRRAEGNHLVYTAAEDKYVLTGGPPSIFDAERGKITGDSLTFFRRDDRVLVEGEAKSPTVTETRVAR